MMLRFLNFFSGRIKSFGFAFRGIWLIIKTQVNFRIHLLAAIIAISIGIVLEISSVEWLILIITIFIVFTAEAINTAIEKLVDLVSPEYNKLAGQIKDIAAGAVLLAAIMSVFVGLIIFLPKLIKIFI